MRVSRGWGAWDQSLALPPFPLGLWLCKGVKDCPSLPRPLLPGFCSLFLAVNYAKRGGKRRVGGGKQGRILNEPGTGPVRKEPSLSPSALLPTLSHGVLEKKGAGWLDWLAFPWGQREGPRPARGAALLFSSALPSPPASPGRECLVPATPSRGQRAGRAGLLSYPLLLPTSSPPRCKPLPPLTHAAPGLAQRGVWDRVRGWESLKERRRAGAIWRPQWPLLCLPHLNHPLASLALVRPPYEGKANNFLLGHWETAVELWEGNPFPSTLPARLPSGQGESSPLLKSNLAPSVHSLFGRSC